MLGYSVLINTCDAYKDVWPMFFHILDKTWQGERPRLYINTETFKCKVSGFDAISLNQIENERMSWGKRLLSVLERIPEEYILLLLEDFYFEDIIASDVIEECVNYMKDNVDIAAFQLIECGEYVNETNIDKTSPFFGFGKRKWNGMYRVSAGPTLWRKSDLIKITNWEDTPWEWEFFGSMRTWLWGKRIYCWNGERKPLFTYDVIHGGAVHRGKWVGYKVRELAERYEFEIDYGNREIEDDWMRDQAVHAVIPKYTRIRSILSNRTKMMVSIIQGICLRIKEKNG